MWRWMLLLVNVLIENSSWVSLRRSISLMWMMCWLLPLNIRRGCTREWVAMLGEGVVIVKARVFWLMHNSLEMLQSVRHRLVIIRKLSDVRRLEMELVTVALVDQRRLLEVVIRNRNSRFIHPSWANRLITCLTKHDALDLIWCFLYLIPNQFLSWNCSLSWWSGFGLDHGLNSERNNTAADLHSLSLVDVELNCLLGKNEGTEFGEIVFQIVTMLSIVILEDSMASADWDVAHSHIWFMTTAKLKSIMLGIWHN